MNRTSLVAAIAIAALGAAPAFAGTINEYQKLIAPDGGENELFGASVAVHADTAVVGAPASLSGGPGAVYTFDRGPDRTWIKDEKLVASGEAGGDGFGVAAAVDEDTLIVGATTEGEEALGAAYVFERRDGDWFERQRLEPDGGGSGFGRSIALEFDTALVGAPGEDGEAGAVYVFERRNGAWERAQKIPSPDPGGPTVQPGRFGTAVALSRDLALVGSPAEGAQGAAYLFRRGADGEWVELRKMTDDDGESQDGFGEAVAVDGNRALIGAPHADDDAGSAYVFELVAGGDWEMKQQLVVANSAAVELFGVSVALDRDTAVVGADGSAHTFTRDPHTRVWTERDDLRASEGSVGWFGWAVGWDGITAFIGASRDDQNGALSGSSFVYRLAPVVSAVFPPTIHPRSRGIVSISVLGSGELDVSTIDPTTLRFGPAGTVPAHDLSDVFTMNNHLQDVNLDGLTDLVVHFGTRPSGIVCGDERATLTGYTFDGRVVEVSGTIQSVGCRRSPGSRSRVVRRDR